MFRLNCVLFKFKFGGEKIKKVINVGNIIFDRRIRKLFRAG